MWEFRPGGHTISRETSREPNYPNQQSKIAWLGGEKWGDHLMEELEKEEWYESDRRVFVDSQGNGIDWYIRIFDVNKLYQSVSVQ